MSGHIALQYSPVAQDLKHECHSEGDSEAIIQPGSTSRSTFTIRRWCGSAALLVAFGTIACLGSINDRISRALPCLSHCLKPSSLAASKDSICTPETFSAGRWIPKSETVAQPEDWPSLFDSLSLDREENNYYGWEFVIDNNNFSARWQPNSYKWQTECTLLRPEVSEKVQFLIDRGGLFLIGGSLFPSFTELELILY